MLLTNSKISKVFIAKQIPHAMHVVKEVILWKKQTSFCTIKLAWQLTKVKKVCLMKDTNSLSHTSYRCKYHIIIIPKYRRYELVNGYRNGEDKNLNKNAKLIYNSLNEIFSKICSEVKQKNLSNKVDNINKVNG